MSVFLHTDKTYVVAKFIRENKFYQQRFKLKDYGSVDAAMKAGRAWEAAEKKKAPEIMPREERMTKSNVSGVVNVFRQPHVIRRKSGAVYEYPKWIARWKGCPKKGGVPWIATPNLDEDDAFVLAFLSHKLRTVNRDKIRAELAKVSKTKRYDEILAMKKV
ncbi:MAG TPA: hypothetical protein VHE13_15835 [Opitutus sp.]|nr:hypothetical protein [Opitutus sp.]